MLTNYESEKAHCLRRGGLLRGKEPERVDFLATLEALFRRRDMDAGLRRYGDLALEPDHWEVYSDGDSWQASPPRLSSS